MFTVLSGIIASIAHVVTGPDHLAAVAPLAIDSRKKSWLIGLLWGLGHTIGMLLIGLLFILFKEFIPIDKISVYSDKIIGLLLIAIGSWAVLRSFIQHQHGEVPHTHLVPALYVHVHKNPPAGLHTHHPLNPGSLKLNGITALSIGIIHGFAGFSHLFALLPSLALPTKSASFIYILSFAAGTIVTMMTFALLLGGVASVSASKNRHHLLKWFTLSGGGLAIGVGIFWIFRNSL